MSESEPNGLRRNLLRIGTVGTAGFLAGTGTLALYSFLEPPIRNVAQPMQLRLQESELRSFTPGTTREYRLGERTLWLCCLKRTEIQRSELLESGTDVTGTRGVVVVDDRIIFALDTRCPHLGCAVVVDSATGGFHCPCHHSVFGPDGTRVTGPATEDMTLFPVATRGSGDSLFILRNRS